MIRLYIIGLAILIIAILANALAIKVDLKTWYDFLNLLNEQGLSAFNKLNILDYLWLVIVYPSVLGLGYWIGDAVHKTILN